MSKYKPYSFWTRAQFRHHFGKQMKAFSITQEWIYKIVDEAVFSEEWNPVDDFNGCSMVEDRYHPCLACFIHDFLWHTGRGGRISDLIFYELMLVDGSTQFKAKFRWIGVRCTWFLYYKWKYLSKGVRKDPTGGMNIFSSTF